MIALSCDPISRGRMWGCAPTSGWALKTPRVLPSAHADIEAICRILHTSFPDPEAVFVGIGRSPQAFLWTLRSRWQRKVAQLPYSLKREPAHGRVGGLGATSDGAAALKAIHKPLAMIQAQAGQAPWLLLDYARTGQTMDAIVRLLEVWRASHGYAPRHDPIILMSSQVEALRQTWEWANPERTTLLSLLAYPLLERHLFCESYDHPFWTQACLDACKED